LIGVAVAAAVTLPRVAVPLLRPVLEADQHGAQDGRPPVTEYSVLGFGFVLLVSPFIVLVIIASGGRKATEASGETPMTTVALALAVGLLVPLVAAVLLAFIVVSILGPRGAGTNDWVYNVVTLCASVITAILVDFRFPSLFPNPADKATWYALVVGLPLGVVAAI
jgi:hypothetical protein